MVPLAERLEIVRDIAFVDDVTSRPSRTSSTPGSQVRFDVIFKGDDWRGTAKGDKLERDFARSASRSCTSPTRCTPRARCCGRTLEELVAR